MTERTMIAISRCGTYDRAAVDAAVRKAVALAGGMRGFAGKGRRVLIKPNLLKAALPEAAVTTHPEIVRSVIRLVHEHGGKALVGDSPGLGDFRRICQRAGILDVALAEGAELVELGDPVEVRNNGRFQRFELSRVAVEADAIINLPKFKTHGMTVLTGAVKNLFGCIPGKRKAQWHFNSGVNHEAFTRMLVELAALLRPRLTIMDAVVGMEGNGPGSGDPRELGVILAGQDPFALDTVAGAIVGLGPDMLPILRSAREAGVGATSLDRIAIVGEDLSAVLARDFRLPPRDHTEWRIPDWLRRTLKDALTTRPLLGNRACIRCGVCEKHCPQQAIHEQAGKLVIDHRNCIRCYCCQEFCPQGAITVGKGWALRVLGG